MDEGALAVRGRQGGSKVAVLALLSIMGVFALGWGVVTVVDALETQDDCGAYGYGGYGGYGCGSSDGVIAVRPSTDLVDRQTVTVRGARFAPRTSFGVAQCDPSAGPDAGTDGCDLSTARTATTDGSGRVQLDMTVRRIIVVQGRRVDCALRPCTIGAATLQGTTLIEATSAPISFDRSVPPVPRLRLAVTVDEVTTSGARGTVTCNRSADAFVETVVQQPNGGSRSSASGFAGSIACEVTPTMWSLRFTSGHGELRSGPAAYDVYASAYDEFESAEVQQSGRINLSGGSTPIEPAARPASR